MSTQVDLFIIGGGINGAAVARDAAGRGLSVRLAEMGDYGSATSSASSKLIHGGIRYLEHFEFKLVRDALHERETMLAIAPHLVTPLRFLLPVTADQPRPAWMVRIGLLLYDLMSGQTRLERTGKLAAQDMHQVKELRPDGIRAILHYPDCQVDDARLVLETLLDARAKGADVRNYCTVVEVARNDTGFIVTTEQAGRQEACTARFVINAAGPWADRVLSLSNQDNPKGKGAPLKLRLVRGSHIVVKAPADARPQAYTLQNADKRVVFVLPWLDGRFRVVGTTDTPHDGEPDQVQCSDAERDYLIAAYNRFFVAPIAADDIVHSWAGVRPLVDDGAADASKVSRDYRLEFSRWARGGLLSIFGGKLTGHRLLGEKVMARLAPQIGQIGKEWTDTRPLHGGDLTRGALEQMAVSPPEGIDPETWKRWVFTYGSCAGELARRAAAQPDQLPVSGVFVAELDYACAVEDCAHASDFLQRRTKLGILLPPEAQDEVRNWFEARRASRPT